ncbi:MAG: dienelactone hydrolase family protein [Candidatus Eisenbacteria bacterium]|uniref:Dienelactone hydrolase family protein n=1 Tax=Eiseniibacteriota bacterium TaxID=2212470 RepID=A0A956LWQ4_UNCEI|nr:dienelactone hydrolase family protein [Candidatus Eisenbacteria bacterium]
MKTTVRELRFQASRSSGEVSAILILPKEARFLYVLGHGAGAGMTHPFMERAATGLADRGIGTLRYQFPYMEAGGRRTDPPALAAATIRSAVSTAAQAAPNLPLLAGGKSFGGRMTSTAQSQEPLTAVAGLAFFGFPLHAAGRPDDSRAAHLSDVGIPMLFLQGTRDALADLTLLRPVCTKLGQRATLHELEGADHGFHVPKRSGRTDDEVMDEALDTFAAWAGKLGV